MTKRDVYVVVDTPKKAKKLKKLLDMFGESYSDIIEGILLNKYEYFSLSQFNNATFMEYNEWSVLSSPDDDKTKVTIKELRNILAKEHLKEGDYVIATIGKTEYIVKVESIWNNEAFINSYEYLCINDGFKHNVQKHGSFTGFKRYATTEEVALLENNPKELVVGKWYKHPNNEYPNWLVYYGENKKCYGFITSGVWDDDFENEWFEYLNKYPMIEATTQEIESALIEEAKRRGYKTDGGYIYHKGILSNIIYNNGTEIHEVKIFKNGKWAEIIKPEEIKGSDIATIEALHDVLLDNHKYDLNSKLLTNARELCRKLKNIVGSN